jgi:DMSO/TMAO reductase YedYZ heme-binding membrane subunit
VLHFLWLVKADHREPLIYLGILALLMLARSDVFRSTDASTLRPEKAAAQFR